jgi:hypothetical protein
MICTYCGDRATGYDHVIPYSYTGGLSGRARKGSTDPGERVPACRDCNSRLGNRMYPGVASKKAAIAEMLQESLDDLGDTEWTQSDLEELGPFLRASIQAAARKRLDIEKRLAFAKSGCFVDRKKLKYERVPLSAIIR